jgi:hypothetical protein
LALRGVTGAVLLVAVLSATASLTHWRGTGLLLAAGNGITRWLQDTESGSAAESALYRLMQLPAMEIPYRRSPRETRPALTELLKNDQSHAALYSLRALEDEQALDFDAAERDWKTWAEHAVDKIGANLDLADFYERRLKPQEELAALEVVGRAPPSEQERYTAPESQRAWQAWERAQRVIGQYALPYAIASREYLAWEQRYPQ